jgi:hypothetical protein
MLISDFCEDFGNSIDCGDINGANNAIIKELANILITRKQDFVSLLNQSGINASIDDDNVRLINLFVSNLPFNKRLMIGSSLLVNMNNQKSNFNGETEIDDKNVKNGYQVLKHCFSGENYSNETGPIGASSLGGGASGGLAGIIAGAVGDIAKATTKISEGQQKKKYGGLDLASKQTDAKNQMVQAILNKKQLQLETTKNAQEAKAKQKRLIYIIGGSILGLALIGFVIYKIKNKSK